MSIDTRAHVHALVDQLPAGQLAAVEKLLQWMIDPVALALVNAPVDDEPLTEEDRRAIAEAEEWSKHNRPIPLEDVLAELGLTMADWETMAKTPMPVEEKPNGSRNG